MNAVKVTDCEMHVVFEIDETHERAVINKKKIDGFSFISNIFTVYVSGGAVIPSHISILALPLRYNLSLIKAKCQLPPSTL